MPVEKSLSLPEENKIINDYIEASNDSEIKSLLSKYKLSNRRLNSILRSNSALMQEIFASKCQLDVYKENRFISEIKSRSFVYLLDQIQVALESENSLSYLDKITKMLETVDKIDRLNRGESTENIKTQNTSTTTTVNVSDLVSQLSTPEEKKAFLLKKMEDLRFSQQK